jgi:hypothetical protein
LNKKGLELLSRLAKSTDALEAFTRLSLKNQKAEADLLAACIEAEYLARNFAKLVKKQNDALSRSKYWHKAVAELRGLAAEMSEDKEPLRLGLANLDLWSLAIFVPPAENEAVRQALDLIARAITWRCGIAYANLAYLGVTRKAYMKKAAENAAIRVLAAGVCDAVRESPLPIERQGTPVVDPNLREIADLAQVILGEIEISTERVREIRRKHRETFSEMFRTQSKRHFDDKALLARSREVG